MTHPQDRLPNSYGVDPSTVDNARERFRIARNTWIVARLQGKRGPTLRTLVKQYRLTIDGALRVIGRDRAWRKTDG